MSSIAYVTDEEMLEYHRLCRNRTILFWRIASKRKIADFEKGDLLFFFARPGRSRRKALIGYAHYDCTVRLSLSQMWKQYGEATGYSSEQRLHNALLKAGKGTIPKTMQCLYLKNVVFFLSPIYPEEAGLSIPNKLESYTYIDKDDPKVTYNILKTAEKYGIDLWTADRSISPEIIFSRDEICHQLAVIAHDIGPDSRVEKEKQRAHRLAEERCQTRGWEMIRGQKTDAMKLDQKNIRIALPYVYQTNDEPERRRELFGKISLYRLLAKQYHLDRNVTFEILSDKPCGKVKELVNLINDEEL